MPKCYEKTLTTRINDLCHKLDLGLIPKQEESALLAQIEELVEQRDRVREALRDGTGQQDNQTTASGLLSNT